MSDEQDEIEPLRVDAISLPLLVPLYLPVKLIMCSSSIFLANDSSTLSVSNFVMSLEILSSISYKISDSFVSVYIKRCSKRIHLGDVIVITINNTIEDSWDPLDCMLVL